MKYKTFRALVIICLLGTAGGGFYCYTLHVQHTAHQLQIEGAEAAAANLDDQAVSADSQGSSLTVPPAVNLPAGATALRPMDVEILAAAAANISGDKVKDAIRGRPWKVNLFKDAGATTVNRLKIDLNRNDKWDEKWSWDPEGLQRQVAPADDEKYTVQTWYDTNLNAWTSAKPKAGAAPTLAETAPGIPAMPAGSTPAGELALRPMDEEILAAAAANISGDKVKDAMKGRAWKVNLFRDAGSATVNRVKIDLDRDDKWDEKWSWKAGRITREVASNDDEVYEKRFFLDKGGKSWLLQ